MGVGLGIGGRVGVGLEKHLEDVETITIGKSKCYKTMLLSDSEEQRGLLNERAMLKKKVWSGPTNEGMGKKPCEGV
jgi:hypothetical protein